MGTSDSLDTNDPKRKLTGVPALNALTSPERSYAHFKPVSLRLSAVDKTQGLFITVFNPLDHPLAVTSCAVG